MAGKGTPRGLFAMGWDEHLLPQLEVTARTLEKYGRKVAYLSDDGGGWLSKNMAAVAAAHVRKSIEKGGENLPGYQTRTYSKYYAKAKAAAGAEYGDHILTGTLMESIKVLNRRYGSQRGSIVGIDQGKKTAKVVMGSNGFYTTGEQVSVAGYTAALEFGWHSDKPRPLILTAMADFASQFAPSAAKYFMYRVADEVEDNLSEATREARSGAGRIASASVSLGEMSQATAGGFSVRESESSFATEDKKNFIDGLRAAGLDEATIQEYVREFNDKI
jgi:hypothetical protein